MISPPDYYKSSVRKGSNGQCLTAAEWGYCFYHFGYSCCVCGRQTGLQGDHWVSRKHGGTSLANNIVPMCRWCNLEKGASPALGWLILKYKSINRAREIVTQVEQYFAIVMEGIQDG